MIVNGMHFVEFVKGMRQAEPAVREAAQRLAEEVSGNRPPELLALVGALALTNEYPDERGKTYGDWADSIVRHLEERGYRIVPIEDEA